MCYYYMNDIKQEGLHAGQFHTVVFREVKTNSQPNNNNNNHNRWRQWLPGTKRQGGMNRQDKEAF